MELQFEKTAWPCLTTATAQAKSEERTQEVRLGDNMPDIGRVLAAWGQVLLRGKEWRSSGITVSAGVMAWVLYAPEDGSEPRLVESWLPVQMKWEFPETRHDGAILADCQLASVDARSVSARKLMIRAVVSTFAEAVVPESVDVWAPGQLPEDVQLLKRSYPVCLPREAGEKSFAVDEEWQLPAPVSRMLCYRMQPEIVDTNVVAGKAVFRGSAVFHILYEDTDGNFHSLDQAYPFSQFADLDRDYDTDAQVRVVPGVTNLEVETENPDRLRIQAGIVGQFVVSDHAVLEVVEDAYSNRRPVTVQQEELLLPTELDRSEQTLRLVTEEPLEADHVIDTIFLCGQPRIRREADGVNIQQDGLFQLLYESNGELKGMAVHAEGELAVKAGDDTTVYASSGVEGVPQISLGKNQVNLRGDVSVTAVTTTDRGIPMVTGLSLGELTPKDPSRPSMILRRSGGAALWDLAKNTGSTMEEIMRINQLQGEPEADRLLLIPIS